MNRWRSCIFFYCSFFLATDISYAAGIIAREQQIKAQRHRQSQVQGMTQQEYQQYQEQQQQQAGGTQNQEAPAPPTYQQTVDDRNKAIAQAIVDAHNHASQNEGAGNIQVMPQVQQQTFVSDTIQQQPTMQQQQVTIPMTSSSMTSADVKEVVDLAEVWKKLDKKSTVWTLLIDNQAKVLTVSEYIDRFHKQGVKISAPPMHYVQMIDQIIQSNPQLLNRPLAELIQISAIVDYDFDNGMDKDDLARKVLGDAGFEENKKRFGR